MSEAEERAESTEELPKAAVRKPKWSFPVIWIVPVIAAVVAGYLVYDRVRAYGPTITIRFKDATGLRGGETPIKHLGVTIAQVKSLELTDDMDHVLVTARLPRGPVSVAREGSVFWIVRPELGVANVSGLGTVISGPHIEVLPGKGAPKSEFIGLESSPVMLERNGLKIALLSKRVGSLRPNSPIYYRGVEVGVVQEADLSADGTMVSIRLFIRERYAPLVRTGSKFWNVSGADVRAGLFSGLDIKVESLRSLLAGGVAFATPDDPNAKPAKNGMVFPLYDQPQKEWLEWSPKIAIRPEK
ncbi:MAG TPA: MlaD family protein [Candidatus Binatia bacterium]|jgi:paraquat-inducible protein B